MSPHPKPEQPPSPFAIALFRNVWTGTLISSFGVTIQGVGAAWLMTRLTSSPTMIALVATSTVVPIMLFALLAGAMADSFERRSVMIAAQLGIIAVSITLTVFAYMDWLTPGLLLLFTFAVGCGLAFNGPASQAVVGEIVPRPVIPAAVALNSMTFNIARSLGPAIGGAVVAATNAAAAFLLNALSSIPLIIVLARWKPARLDNPLPRERIWHAMQAGLRFGAMSPDILRVMPRAGLFGFAIAALSGLMPVIAKDQLGGGALTFGLLLGAYGVGSVAAGLALSRLRRHRSSEQLVVLSSLAAAIGTAIVAFSPFLLLSMAGLLIAGVGWVLALSTCNTAIQLAAPRWVVARMLSLYQMTTFGGFAVGAAAFGALADAMGLMTALLVAASIHLISVAYGWLLPIVEAERDLSPFDWQAPDLVVPIEGRSGPIIISITYEIEEHDSHRFLQLMQERRRVRRRDGAHGWRLMRDLGHPNRWIERYDFPTWHEYLRHNTRPTLADADNWQAVRALHSGATPPVVSRFIERQTGNLPSGREPSARELADYPIT
ncbi:MFS transporter [Blastomonas sp.]|uniref:MFS transporter n=1 Tax=Blastomonas sp. TaxID=1909299 RepID=UPI00391DD976